MGIAAGRLLRKASPRRAKDWLLRRRPLPAMTADVYGAATVIAGVQPPPESLITALPFLVAGLRSSIRGIKFILAGPSYAVG
jgi:hypothetical protein